MIYNYYADLNIMGNCRAKKWFKIFAKAENSNIEENMQGDQMDVQGSVKCAVIKIKFMTVFPWSYSTRGGGGGGSNGRAQQDGRFLRLSFELGKFY